MKIDYRKSHLQQGKGNSYHATFSDEPYRNMVWQFEKRILDNILTESFKNCEVHQLDFACGTGRILSHLEDRTKSSVGVDVSASMLDVARTNSRGAEIIEADLTRDDVLGGRKFNLITAFRFFPNAEDSLRADVMQVLSRHLDDNGYLVFNNHKNTGSTRNRLARLIGRQQGYRGMSLAETKALLAENHMKTVKIFALSIFPASSERRLLPIFLLRPIEAFLSKCRPFRDLGENLIFVCQRAVKPSDEKK